MPGGLGLRWSVWSSTGINFCGLIQLEDGVIIKYDRPLSFQPTPPQTVWFKNDTDLSVIYILRKFTAVSPSSFTAFLFPQPG